MTSRNQDRAETSDGESAHRTVIDKLACARKTLACALARIARSMLEIIARALVRLVYRPRVHGIERIPARGGALLISNHLSYADAALLTLSLPRPVRFVMHDDMYRRFWLRPWALLWRAIPISSEMRPRELSAGLRAVGDAVRHGDLVCLFAEGQVSRIGQLLPFYRGFEHAMRGVAAPILPLAIDNVWGSVFSFSKERAYSMCRSRRLRPVTILVGQPLPPTAKRHEVRQAVAELLSEAWEHRKSDTRTLAGAFLRTARRHPFRMAMTDSRSAAALRFSSALTRAILLARRLQPLLARQKRVGVLLPPSVTAALSNHALLFLGKVPVNLNYTMSGESLASCARRCNLETIVTSRSFLERLKLAPPARCLFLEDVVARVGILERTLAILVAAFAPAPLLLRWLGARRASIDDTATVIFSSGSTGDPKGIVLSHWNIMANVMQMVQIFPLAGHDRVLAVLPFFHCFGFTVTYALPAVLGVGAIYHANPLEARVVGELARRNTATFLPATPTFLAHYARRIPAAAFGSLHFVLAGAEKLTDDVADLFEDRFSLRPREGYGCSECAPVVCASVRDFRAAGFRQSGERRHSVGHPLPGVSVRIVDPQTMTPLPHGRPGLLLVRGPNVMRGYLGQPEATAKAVRDGWYATGDIATVDADGFVCITDRLSRFSKIGGEMVPHLRIENALRELAGTSERSFAVVGVPDGRRGERLVVAHTLTAETLFQVVRKMQTWTLPRLWTPRPDDFIQMDALPFLGSGKLDLARLREIAQSARSRISAAACVS